MQDLLRGRAGALLYSLVGVATLGVFVADYYTPLGVAVWILYVVPLVLTLLGRDPRAPLACAALMSVLMGVTLVTDAAGVSPGLAYTNRACGMAALWTVAFVARSLISTRNRVLGEERVNGTRSAVFEAVQGELTLAEVGARGLDVLARAASAPLGALYARDEGGLVLVAAQGLVAGSALPPRFELGEGLVGEVARSRRPRTLSDVPSGFFNLRSALADGPPRHLALHPLEVDGAVQGVIELGFLHPPEADALQVLDRTRDALAIALRSARDRARLRALLEETQSQSEALRVQQEELRVTNEELEEQSRALKSSHVLLEEQQAELEASNAQLEVQANELEQEKQVTVLARREAERASQYKSEFLANMSHELRTPLNSALILSRLLSENKEGRLSEEQVRYAETIYSAGNNLLTIINDILDLSKIEAGAVQIQLEDTPLRGVVEAVRRTFLPISQERGVPLLIEIASATPATINTDAQRLQQVLTNLLSNAFKFTEKGQVALTIAPHAGARAALEIRVRDSGVGIPADKLDVIFQAFQQADGSTHRKYGGTGLGLSISLELARLLGGDITVESEPGQGSTFTLTLPVRPGATPPPRTRTLPPPSARRSPTAPTPSRPAITGDLPPARAPERLAANITPGALPDDRHDRRRPGRLILVVEDDLAFARILYDLAHELDFDCVVATSIDEGMALAREMPPSGVLLDVALPDGSGLTLLDRLKRNPDTRHIPVHTVSAGDHAHTALELGAIGHALKPVQRDDLVKAVQMLQGKLEQRVRRVLVIEDDAQLRDSTQALLQIEGVVVEGAGTAAQALGRLASESFDCVVLDLHLPDANGFEILETMAGSERYSFPPVIVYTGKDLSRADEERLRRFSRSVIVKGARSPERLLDEVTLFLHQVESRLPPDSRRLLRRARERDALFEGKTILIVEDDVRNIFALSSILEPRGARVIIARNGREGVEQVAANSPDLVLMDIMMPEMDGLTAMRALRGDPANRDLPIIALTAKAMRDDYERCLEAGANDYMAKPLDVDKLVSLCRVWMSR